MNSLDTPFTSLNRAFIVLEHLLAAILRDPGGDSRGEAK